MNAVVSPSAGLGRAGSGMTYAAGLAATGAEIFARRLALTAFGFAFFTAINGQDVKHETRRRKENYSAKSNFKDFLKPRQVFCAIGGDQRDVFQPHAADFRIVKPRLHGHDCPAFSLPRELAPMRGASWMSRPSPWPVPWKNPSIRPLRLPVW